MEIVIWDFLDTLLIRNLVAKLVGCFLQEDAAKMSGNSYAVAPIYGDLLVSGPRAMTIGR